MRSLLRMEPTNISTRVSDAYINEMKARIDRGDPQILSKLSTSKHPRQDEVLPARSIVHNVGRQNDARMCVQYATRSENIILKAQKIEDELQACINMFFIPLNYKSLLRSTNKKLRDLLHRTFNATALLQPPLSILSLSRYRQYLAAAETQANHLQALVQVYKHIMNETQRVTAVILIQRNFRTLLQHRNFYSTSIQLSHQHRGIVSGLLSPSKDPLGKQTTVHIDIEGNFFSIHSSAEQSL